MPNKHFGFTSFKEIVFIVSCGMSTGFLIFPPIYNLEHVANVPFIFSNSISKTAGFGFSEKT